MEAPESHDSKNKYPSRLKVKEGIATLFDNWQTYVPTSLGFILNDKLPTRKKSAYKIMEGDSSSIGFLISDERVLPSSKASQLQSTFPLPITLVDHIMSAPPHPQLTFEDTKFYANFSANYDYLVECIGKSMPLGPEGLESLHFFIQELNIQPSTTYNMSEYAHLLQPPDDAQHLMAMIAPDSTLIY
ncbi:hypothetical protein QCA50_006375 [Cerrena zonata]|uniref:Uncharacterized protein n=1 Tax=Cerrena zonata TaxID=2478898 RepID=A0AAW0G8R5_9APHY